MHQTAYEIETRDSSADGDHERGHRWLWIVAIKRTCINFGAVRHQQINELGIVLHRGGVQSSPSVLVGVRSVPSCLEEKSSHISSSVGCRKGDKLWMDAGPPFEEEREDSRCQIVDFISQACVKEEGATPLFSFTVN